MVAYAPYVAASASLSSVYHAFTPSAFRTAPVCSPAVTATVTHYATARPTTNPHGHGGPYYNPYNDVPLPFIWPGTVTQGQVDPPPYPTAPYSYGGPAKDDYEEPCWIPKGSDELTRSISTFDQCGNSKWGLIDCPHLPVGGLTGGNASSLYATSSRPPYPYSTASGYNATGTGSPYYSANSTRASPYGTTGTSTPTSSLCSTLPDTGVTRTYDLHVAYQTIAPDGVERNGLTINGQYPGPLVEANW